MLVQFVCGTWDEGEGHPSSIGDIICDGIEEVIDLVQCFNGGNIQAIPYLKDMANNYDAVIWMPNISNSVDEKYVDEIKKINKKCILVTSKRNDAEVYSFSQLINHALNKHSNLTVEIERILDEQNRSVFRSRLFDPLGNVFQNWTFEFDKMGRQIANRILELKQFTRFGSTRVGEAIEVPNEEEFFELIKTKAEKFTEIIASVSVIDRFLGNASFRCQRGFPSFRHGEHIFVSKRNIDKSHIDKEGFVAVNAGTIPVEYYGDHKPSVDTPTQIALYQMFPNVNYILHGHVYLDCFSMTNRCIPCGAIEEVHEIKKHYDDAGYTSFGINLRGHGFIVLADTLDRMRELTKRLKKRPMPEIIK